MTGITRPLKIAIVICATLGVTAAACAGGSAGTPTATPTSGAAATATRAPAATLSPGVGGISSGTPTAAVSGNVAQGQTLFAQNCVCHLQGGRPPAPAQLGQLPPSTIEQTVRQGRDGMPSFSQSQVTNQQLQDITAYLESLH